MSLSKRFIVMLLCALLCAPASLARQVQDQQRDPQSNNTLSQDVLIIIQQEKVRFTAQKTVAEMQLKVFDQTGEMVYDSGAIAEPELNWPLKDANGQVVKSGMYAYQLSIKEAGSETARVRRGHFIVDRAQDRDGADKLWVTSQNGSGVGAELTVARDENATLAGVSTKIERTVGRSSENSKRDASGREVEAKTQNHSDAERTAASAAPAGTAGKIAKFTSATEIGDSAITEQNGLVGIGTTTPESPLHVYSPASNTVVAQTAGGTNAWAQFRVKSPNQTWAIGTSQNFNGDQFYLFDVNRNQIRMGVQPDGEVSFPGAGSNHVVVHTSGGANAWAQFRMRSTNQTWAIGTSQNFNGDQFYLFDVNRNQIRMGIQPNGGAITFPLGNVGIGAPNPTSKLQVEGAGIVEMAINSLNERAVLALGNTLSAGRYVWTVESGVRGIPGVFGVYNRVVNKSGLEIDGNLQVYVKSLQITGGADISEKFDVLAGKNSAEAGATEIQPGMVVAIDPINPGKLRLSRRAYDRNVAGVISGAGGVQPGMMLGQEGTLADGKHPVALGGRVYVWVDATRGAVKPGDMLTTSVTPGHAMKATNTSKAQGAIIGKAMTGLKRGKGLVLTLVTLR